MGREWGRPVADRRRRCPLVQHHAEEPGGRRRRHQAQRLRLLGSKYLWFSATEAGDAAHDGERGFAIERSTDGGRTWAWAPIPCTSGCSASFSFLSPDRGFLLLGGGLLYQTSDGGRRWSVDKRMTTRPRNGQVDFLTEEKGWLTAGRTLETTGDGGASWTKVKLPASPATTHPAELSAPYFFSSSTGVVAARFPDGKGAVYTTVDGGRKWGIRPIPVAPSSGQVGWYEQPSFSVMSARLWSLTDGRRLYVTDNSGHTWTPVRPHHHGGKGTAVWAFAMVSASTGWAAADATACHRPADDYCSQPILVKTTDAGEFWHAVATEYVSPVGDRATR